MHYSLPGILLVHRMLVPATRKLGVGTAAAQMSKFVHTVTANSSECCVPCKEVCQKACQDSTLKSCVQNLNAVLGTHEVLPTALFDLLSGEGGRGSAAALEYWAKFGISWGGNRAFDLKVSVALVSGKSGC